MGRLHFGLVVPECPLPASRRHSYLADVNRVLAYVKGHYDSAWFIDHLDGPMLEGWTALTYLAALHPELRWGHSVLCHSYRSPALLAKMAATLQELTGGRFVLGLGAGGEEADYRAFGYPFPPGSTRVAELDEALSLIKALWTTERTTFAGRFYRVHDARCEPRPNPPPSIMVGAFRPRMLRLVARHADWWNVAATGITGYRQYVAEFQRACDDVGRDPATVRRVWSGGCVCAPTGADVAALAATRRQALGEASAYHAGEDFMGTPAQIIEQMQPFIELGVDTFLLDCGGFPRLTTVELLVSEVLPALRGATPAVRAGAAVSPTGDANRRDGANGR